MFLAFLALLFGGGAFWGFRTEEGRDFFGGLIASIGNWISNNIPGLQGAMGFLNPEQDPEGRERLHFVENGNVTLLRQGMQRFAGVPAEVAEAIAPDRPTFDRFLTALGPAAVADISRTPDTDTITRNIRPTTISRVMSDPVLAPRILQAATQMAGRSGQRPDPNSNAGRVLAAVQGSVNSLLLDREHEGLLRATLRENPNLLAQARPLLERMAGQQAAPFIEAATSSPQAFLGLAAAARDANLSMEQLLRPGGPEAAITPELLTGILSRREIAAPLLRAAETATAAGGSPNALTARLQDAAEKLLGDETRLRQVLSGNPDILSQIIPAAAASAARAGRPTGTSFDLPALLGNPALRGHLQREGQVEAVTAALSDAVTRHGANLRLSPDMVKFLTDHEAHHTRVLVTLAADPQGNRFLSEALPLLTPGQPLDTGRITALALNYPEQVSRLLRSIDLSALPADPAQRSSLIELRNFAMARTPDGRSNLDALTGALGALRRPDGTYPAEAGQAVQAMLALRGEGLPEADRIRHTTALTRAALGLLATTGGENALASLRQLNLSGLQGTEQTQALLGSLTSESIRLLHRAAPHLSGLDDTTLTQLIPSATAIGQGQLRLETLSALASQPAAMTALQGILGDISPDDVPAAHRETFTRAQAILGASAHTPAGTPARSNLQVIGTLLTDSVLRTPEGSALSEQLGTVLTAYQREGTRPTTEQTAMLTQSALQLARLPEASTLLTRLGQLDLTALHPGLRDLRVLNEHNLPLIQKALTSLNADEQRNLHSLLADAMAGKEVSFTGARGRSLLRNAEVQRLLTGMSTEGLSDTTVASIRAARETFCGGGGIRGFFGRALLGAPQQNNNCAAEPAPQHMSDAGNAPSPIPGLSSSISGGTHVGADTRVHAAATPRVAEAGPHQATAGPNVA